MILRILLFCVFAAPCPGQAISVRDVTPTPVLASRFVPRWSGDALAVVEGDALVHFYGQSGALRRSVSVTISGASFVRVRDASYGRDGTAVLCGFAVDPTGRGGNFLAISPPDGTSLRIIRTDPYGPAAVTVAPDGTIWTKGHEIEGPGKLRNTNAGIVRQFDATGREVRQFLPQSGFGQQDLATGDINLLAASETKVGWYASRGTRYYEIESNGTVHSHPVAPPGQHGAIGLALLSTGDAFVTVNPAPKIELLFRLDRAKGIWVSMDLTETAGPNTRNFVAGGFGNTLVTWGAKGALRFLTLQ
jgi:hypothetical protein